MKTKLDAAVVAAAECPPYSKRLDIYCTHTKGLMLEVRPSGGKTYHIRYTNEHGVMKQLKVARADQVTFQQAQKKARQMLAEAALGNDLLAEKQKRRAVPTFAALADDHIKHARTHLKSAKTLEGYMKRIKKRWGKLRLTEIRARDIASWTADLRKEGLAPATIVKTLAIMSRTFELGARWGIAGTEKNPVRAVPKPKVANGRQVYITADEAARLIKAAGGTRNPQTAQIVQLLLLCGMRVSELLSARWANVDLDKRTLFVPTSKTGKSRYVPLSTVAVEVIQGLPRRDGAIFLFPNPRDPKKHITTIKHAWQTAREAAALPDLRIHDLRHSAASFMVNAGVDLFAVGKVLGHASYQSTQRYSHLANDTLLAAVEAGARKQQATA